MKIKRDDRMWYIGLSYFAINSVCEYRDFPYNIERCNHFSVLPNGDRGGVDTLCTLENCPIRIEV